MGKPRSPQDGLAGKGPSVSIYDLGAKIERAADSPGRDTPEAGSLGPAGGTGTAEGLGWALWGLGGCAKENVGRRCPPCGCPSSRYPGEPCSQRLATFYEAAPGMRTAAQRAECPRPSQNTWSPLCIFRGRPSSSGVRDALLLVLGPPGGGAGPPGGGARPGRRRPVRPARAPAARARQSSSRNCAPLAVQSSRFGASVSLPEKEQVLRWVGGPEAGSRRG